MSQQVKLPEGVHIDWTGEFENEERAARTLMWVFPAVLLVIFLLLYLTYHDLTDAGLMMLAVPEAIAGGIFFLFLFPKLQNGWDSQPLDFSVAVRVGFIACFGMATETGIIMLVYSARSDRETRGTGEHSIRGGTETGGDRGGSPPIAAETADGRGRDHRDLPHGLRDRRRGGGACADGLAGLGRTAHFR